MRLSTAVLCLGLSLLVFTGGCSEVPKSELVVVESEGSANQVLYELGKVGIVGTRESETRNRKPVFRILVEPGHLQQARSVLVRYNLPRESHGGFAQMLESAGMIPTQTDERARLMHAIAEELTRTLESMNGVVMARVHVYLPETNPLSGSPDAQPSVAVMAKVTKGTKLDEASVRPLVAGALPKGGESKLNLVVEFAPDQDLVSADGDKAKQDQLLLATREVDTQKGTIKLMLAGVVALSVAVMTLLLLLVQSRKKLAKGKMR